ncbi:MAG: HAMP domain-containing histidine kinase [Sphingobacteriaceae bacterium]|nr:MAG: HAMP domain-containing histidine kinase [Sphingobacteriaceae bacterium]
MVDVLDFARGRLGEGIILTLNTNEPMEELLNQVITELRTVSPDRVITTDIRLNEPVKCDGRRIAQLFSNILGNALTHGKKGAVVSVQATSDNGEFILSVTNTGNKIPEAAMERLFQPFSRGEVVPSQQGLGLGLYIASEIVRAHGGTLNVTSTDEQTCFTFKLPASGN